MRGVLRVVRNVLAALSFTVIVTTTIYMAVMGRMHSNTRREGGYVASGWGKYRW